MSTETLVGFDPVKDKSYRVTSGGRLETLKDVLGHTSIRTTFDEYAHLDTRDVLADLAIIESRR